MADEAFDAAFQCDRRRWAARAGAVHREIEVAVPVALVDDVAAVLCDRRADARFDQLLDLVDDVGVGRVFLEIRFARDVDSGGGARREQRRAADEMVEQRLDHEGFEIAPGDARSGGDRDEIAAVEDPFDEAAVE